jgi:AraC-like DNA-binding protein
MGVMDGPEWVRYRRVDGAALEAMHAHFRQHAYHRHSHETYSFGVTEVGAQAFTCRGGRHVSAAGMVMAFNPDEAHDGWAATADGFTYRMVHLGPDLLGDVLSDLRGGRAPAPLFAEPALHEPAAAHALRRLHSALLEPAGPVSALERDERLMAAVAAVSRMAGPVRLRSAAGPPPVARRARDVLRERFLDDVGAADLADAVGHSRFGVYRAFLAAYGMSPSEFQRQQRLRAARVAIDSGHSLAAAAAVAGFADQSHLTRWFVRYFGVTPGQYRRSI